MDEKKLSDLSYDELMEKVRQIRQGRVMPEKKRKVVKSSLKRVRKNRANKLLDSLSPKEREALLARLKEKSE